MFSRIKTKLSHSWPLIKSYQTGLLLTTGIAGYISARCPVMHWYIFLGLIVSLALAISGSTVLNMWYDRDIDAKMTRTCNRPLVKGSVSPNEAFCLGLGLSTLGVSLATWLNPFYGLVVFAGLFTDVIIYTVWLKRRTCWSIVWGGISGGMPILAGRVLGSGQIDGVGLLLGLAVLFWIPTHILTFSLRHQEDYKNAGIPTFVSTYGTKVTRVIIAGSSIAAALCIGTAGILTGVRWGLIRVLAALSGVLLVLALWSIFRPNEKVNFGLFKFSSVYMLGSMILLSFGAL